MATMVCDECGRQGIRWMGPLVNLTHTECPHCGGRNCQRLEMAEDEDCGCGMMAINLSLHTCNHPTDKDGGSK